MTATPRPDIAGPVDRCAYRADLRGDVMTGTAFPAARILLVEDPGPWGPDGLRDCTVDRGVAAELHRRTAAVGIRVQLIRRPGRGEPDPSGRRTWAFADIRPELRTLHRGSYRDAQELLDLSRLESGGTPVAEPVYLVCAHGNHDVCCAVRGRATAAALAAERPGQVWETSHLGGDRFAASVLALPAGLVYGRVPAARAAELAAATDRGDVIPDLLRGQAGIPSAVQVALAHAHAELSVAAQRDLHVIERRQEDAGVTVVRLAGPHGEVEVRLVAERVAADGLTCHRPGPAHYWTHRPIALTTDG